MPIKRMGKSTSLWFVDTDLKKSNKSIKKLIGVKMSLMIIVDIQGKLVNTSMNEMKINLILVNGFMTYWLNMYKVVTAIKFWIIATICSVPNKP